MKNIMKRAWEIAREGVKKFGGKVKEYFVVALKLAWKEFKDTVANENGYVKLVGSEKQVKWANDIREDISKMVRTVLDYYSVNGRNIDKQRDRFNKVVELIEEKVLNNEKADFFIGNFAYTRDWDSIGIIFEDLEWMTGIKEDEKLLIMLRKIARSVKHINKEDLR
ncbi:hypothetical protein NST12_16705 [Bacillus sp. FSL W8-1127]|uniref:hypothetical protein n=1 Tax=Bacillus sp. FSL W8-1127 TaxID=2954710 RepID=UPI0030F8EC18